MSQKESTVHLSYTANTVNTALHIGSSRGSQMLGSKKQTAAKQRLVPETVSRLDFLLFRNVLSSVVLLLLNTRWRV